MDGRPNWTDYDEAGDYVVPNVFSPRDLVSGPDNMDKTVPHNCKYSTCSKLFNDKILIKGKYVKKKLCPV